MTNLNLQIGQAHSACLLTLGLPKSMTVFLRLLSLKYSVCQTSWKNRYKG